VITIFSSLTFADANTRLQVDADMDEWLAATAHEREGASIYKYMTDPSADLWTRQFRGEENLLVHSGMAKRRRAWAPELRPTVSRAVPQDAHAPSHEHPCPDL